MKEYAKIFGIAFIVFSVIIYIGVTAFTNMYKPDDFDEVKPYQPEVTLPDGELKEVPKTGSQGQGKKKTELEKLVEGSERVNVLVVGHEDARTDTIMFASYDPEKQMVDVISIPRDTYINVTTFLDQVQYHKINSVYGQKESKGGGIRGLMQQVANILQVPIDYYVQLDYQAVSSVVDVLGGIEVDVKMHMRYDDPKSNPPTHIDIQEGLQVLNGSTAIDYLRWRQNNEGTVKEGDVQRTARQREFVMKVIKKSLSKDLPAVVSTGFKFVKTDMDLAEMAYYGNSAVSLNMSNVETYILPGDVSKNGSYYMHDYDAVDALMQEIYKKE